MQVNIDYPRGYELFDLLVDRFKRKQYPFAQAQVPQLLIPSALRVRPRNKPSRELALFYFYACIYMRGGIESGQAFTALLAMREKRPDLFDPVRAEYLKAAEVQPVLKQFIGWDSKAASENWVENSRRLMRQWDGNPFLLFKGVDSYEEALRRMRNKMSKRDRLAAGPDGIGFRGFQPKMVSMLTYFFDWEGWLNPHFLYPAPADFHNFRLGFNQGVITLEPASANFVIGERISKHWRALMMRYLEERRDKVTPRDLADAVWFFSLEMCGNSPLCSTGSAQELTLMPELPHKAEPEPRMSGRYREGLSRSCLRCPISASCSYAIPSKPYYRKGRFVLRERLREEKRYGRIDPDKPVPKEAVQGLLFTPGS